MEHIRDFPILAALKRVEKKKRTQEVFCSGFVIDDKIVASAAHCEEGIIKGSTYTYYACGGTANVHRGKNRLCKGIRQTLIPQKYISIRFFCGYDFMIVALAKSIMKGGVRPVTLNFQGAARKASERTTVQSCQMASCVQCRPRLNSTQASVRGSEQFWSDEGDDFDMRRWISEKNVRWRQRESAPFSRPPAREAICGWYSELWRWS